MLAKRRLGNHPLGQDPSAHAHGLSGPCPGNGSSRGRKPRLVVAAGLATSALESSASGRRRLPLGSGRHGRHPRALVRTLVRSLRRSLGLGRWRRRSQAECLTNFGFELDGKVLVILQELAGVLAPLPNAFALVAEPCPGLLDNIVVDRQIE